jgi:hypothetical protein
MRYDEFRDRLQAALRVAGLLSHMDRPEETLDVNTTARHWRAHLLPRSIEPFSAGATISFDWDPFESARSYTCEEDLHTELFGRGSTRSTQRRLVRVDIAFHASLPYGSTTPMPAPDVWAPWVESVEAKIDSALAGARRGSRGEKPWRGDLELEGRTSPTGAFCFHAMTVSAFEMIAVPRIWDDPRRREREPSAGPRIDGLAERFRAALDEWLTGVGELVRWLQHAPAPAAPRRLRKPSGSDEDAGPETTH